MVIDCNYKGLGGLEHNALEEDVLSVHKALREETFILKKDHFLPSEIWYHFSSILH